MQHEEISVLLAISRVEGGGPDAVLRSVSPHLRGRVAIVVFDAGGSRDDLCRDLELAGVEIYRNSAGWSGAARLIHRLWGPRTVFSPQCWRTLLLGRLLRKGRILAPTSHNLPWLEWPLELGWRGRIVARAHVRLFRAADSVLSLTPEMGSQLLDRRIRRVAVVENPIAAENVAEPGVRDSFHVLSIGRLIHRKSPLVLVEALLLLPDHVQRRIRVTFAGDGPLASELRDRLELSGVASFSIGPVNSVSGLLSEAGVLVSCSVAEGLPMAVLEGAASGLRLILSDIEPHRLVLGALDAEGHRLVPPMDSVQLAATLSEVLGEDFDGRESANSALREYAATSVAARYDAEFDQLRLARFCG